MFSLIAKAARTPVRQLCARGFASRAVYLGNVSHLTSQDQLSEIFSQYGNIAGIRLNTTTDARYRYAHVYFGSGEVPVVNDVQMYMSSRNPTESELEEVNEAVRLAIEKPEVHLDGNTIYVKESIPKNQKSPNAMSSQEQSAFAAREANAYKRGFSEGYRQAQVDNAN
ncbi:hypothetical protein IWW48_006149 [Coemansia sp. RSA 1200]|nr:hypothetical protein IWW48_006149 [Coemansia sp. RSA 1200]